MNGGIWSQRLLSTVRQEERSAIGISAAYFFCLLCSYYMLRPLRDEMGIAGGVANLPWVFTATFVAMLCVVPLFGWLTARFTRRRLLPLIYGFFILSLLLFYGAFQVTHLQALVARVFFVWTSVFNLFVVSVFWSLMADLFSMSQGKRLFGFVAAGGSAGAMAGPLFTALAVDALGPANMLPAAALVLGGALYCVYWLLNWSEENGAGSGAGDSNLEPGSIHTPLGGGVWAGAVSAARSRYLLGICLFIWLFTSLSTFVYFEQAHIVAGAFDDPARRTALFAAMDLAVNVLTIVVQVLVTGRVMNSLGLAPSLTAVPLAVLLGFMALALWPTLGMLVIFQVLRRAGNYAITRPAREVLFTVVEPEAKYKAKNFIDTVVYRGGDALSGWLFAGLKGLGLGLSGIALVAVPVAALWALTAWRLGRWSEGCPAALEGQKVRECQDT